jgi:serine/threonine protein kinase
MLTGNPDLRDYSLKILDFGIARAVGEHVDKHLATMSSTIGTPLYMAPEQQTAGDTVGPPADLYAVTAIFYELLLGVTPGSRRASFSLEAMGSVIAMNRFSQDRSLGHGLSHLGDLIDKGLSTRMRNRHQSAREYLDEMEQIEPYRADKLVYRNFATSWSQEELVRAFATAPWWPAPQVSEPIQLQEVEQPERCTGCGWPLQENSTCPSCTRTAFVQTAGLDGVDTVVALERRRSQLVLKEHAVFHDRFVVQRKLGAGAMGSVYLAFDKVNECQVALKIIAPELFHDLSARQRFRREGLIGCRIRHPNIVAIFELGEIDDQMYLVMEYVRGETLRRRLNRALERQEDIPFATAWNVIRHVLEAVGVAHSANVVHRDLKPENIMLTGNWEEGDCSVKVLDFGIARPLTGHEGSSLATMSSSAGSPLYMAPEQRTAADTVGPPADIYAVAAIFHELLTGVPPGRQVSPISRERPDVPRYFVAVIEKGLSNAPTGRFQTAQEFMAAVAQTLDPIQQKKWAESEAKWRKFIGDLPG